MAMLVEKHNLQQKSLQSAEADLKYDQGLVKELEEELRRSENREQILR